METVYEKCQFKLKLIFESKRLETFKDWPYSEDKPCSASKLAEAGFYFTGTAQEPDSVQCFLCDKALDGWEENDDPWIEHIRHSKNCEFAQLRQPEEALARMQFNNFNKQLLIKELKASVKDIQKEVDLIYVAKMHKLKKDVRSLKGKLVI